LELLQPAPQPLAISHGNTNDIISRVVLNCESFLKHHEDLQLPSDSQQYQIAVGLTRLPAKCI